MLGMITTAAHKRIVAEKDAEIAGLMKRLQGQEAVSDSLHKTIWRMDVEMAASTQALRKAHARLSPFTTPRARDSRGRFTKDAA